MLRIVAQTLRVIFFPSSASERLGGTAHILNSIFAIENYNIENWFDLLFLYVTLKWLKRETYVNFDGLIMFYFYGENLYGVWRTKPIFEEKLFMSISNKWTIVNIYRELSIRKVLCHFNTCLEINSSIFQTRWEQTS